MKLVEQKVSVIIPTLNRCETLPRAIDSVLKQSLQAHEIIVVDNGSNDSTLEMIKLKYPFVRLLREKKIGVSAARNRGIGAATGTWVALLDSDDEWLPNKLQRQIEICINSKKSLRLVHTNEIWKKNHTFINQMKKHKKSGGYIFTKCLLFCCISPSSTLLRKDLFDEIGYFDENLPACEDYDLWLRICSKEEVLFVDENLIIKHGGHSDQLSQKYWGMDRFRVYSLEKLICSAELSPENRACVHAVLISKILVLITGGLKRNNLDLVAFYSKKKEFWVNEGVTFKIKEDQRYKNFKKEFDYYR